MTALSRGDTLTVRVARIQQETPAIKRFELVAPDGGDLPPFSAGAHVDVHLGNGLIRPYSLANAPSERHRYVLGVLREKESSGGSAWMHDAVQEGTELTISAPMNDFPLQDKARSHLLIGGGIGITPLLSMAAQLRADGASFALHYCTRSREETAFRGDVEALCSERATFHHDGGDPSRGVDLDKLLAQRPTDAHLYVCGPQGLLKATRKAARNAGWPGSSVHYELFAAPQSDSGVADAEFTVYLARSDRELIVPAHKSILQVLRDAGFEMDSFCERGNCATCETPVLSGNIDHRDAALTDEQKARNDRMMVCVSRAPAGERIVLDI